MSGRTRTSIGALATALAVVAAGCYLPYGFGGAKGADIGWVVESPVTTR